MSDTGTSSRQRWLARGALTAGVLAVLGLIAAAGGRGVALLLLILGHYVVIVAGLWLFVAHRGMVRALGLVVAVGAAVSVPLLEAANNLLWEMALCVGLLLVAVAAARAAVGRVHADAPTAEIVAAPPRQPFVIMNPRSGGGKVGRFDLREKAERLGAEVFLLEGPGEVDVAEVARKAVADGADLLGVAGGDGTQALVAGVAAEHDIPLMVIPAGTRNHFALDLGLDRDDPSRSLTALVDGADLRLDLGDIAGRPFVNNASFGAYAAIVTRPDYRNDKRRVTLDVLPDLLTAKQGPQLTVRADDDVVAVGPAAALVSNNPYGMGDIAGLGRRARLDRGMLGLVAVRVTNTAQAITLLRGVHARGVIVLTAKSVVIDSNDAAVPVGIDGESITLPTPVRCQVRAGALRVRVPRDRPGVPPVREPLSLARLFTLAAPRRAHPRATT